MLQTDPIRLPDGEMLESYFIDAPGNVLLWVHGGFEYAERYEEVFAELGSAGIAVISYDLRGHGRSTGIRAHIQSFEQYLTDLDAVFNHYQADLEGRKLYAFGHSTGGLILARYLQTRTTTFAGVVLSSPFFGVKVPVPGWKRLTAALLNSFWSTFALDNALQSESLTRDPDQVRKHRLDNRILRKVTVGWFESCLAAQKQAITDAPKITTPLLILQAGNDLIVDAKLTELFAKRLPAPTRTRFELIPDAYHELLFDTARPEVLKLILDFVR